MNKADLLRNISHVSAWVALALPPTKAAELHITENDSLSPVTVLTAMLSLRGRQRLDDRARVALDTVRSCCKMVLDSEPASYDRRHDWFALQQQLPKRRRTTGDLVVPGEGNAAVTPDVLMFKRLRQLNRGVCKWLRRVLFEKDNAMADMEKRLG